jgi:hypothetical protein
MFGAWLAGSFALWLLAGYGVWKMGRGHLLRPTGNKAGRAVSAAGLLFGSAGLLIGCLAAMQRSNPESPLPPGWLALSTVAGGAFVAMQVGAVMMLLSLAVTNRTSAASIKRNSEGLDS